MQNPENTLAELFSNLILEVPNYLFTTLGGWQLAIGLALVIVLLGTIVYAL